MLAGQTLYMVSHLPSPGAIMSNPYLDRVSAYQIGLLPDAVAASHTLYSLRLLTAPLGHAK